MRILSSRTVLITIAAVCFAATASCNSSSTTPTPIGASGATLQSVAPLGGATGVNSTGPFTMTFSGPIGQGMEQFVDLHRGDASGPVQTMQCNWSGDRLTMTCRPDIPMDPDEMYTLHLGGGMMDGSGLRVSMDRGLQMGGQRLTSGMMSGMHAGQSMSAMMDGWRAADGSYGMLFSFRTAR